MQGTGLCLEIPIEFPDVWGCLEGMLYRHGRERLDPSLSIGGRKICQACWTE